MNRSAVKAGRPPYPRATCAPPMNNSPTTPTGTTFTFRSTTYTVVLATGTPIGGASCPPSTATLAHTVVSVGPYAFTTRQPEPHTAAKPDSNRSPAVINVATPPKSPGRITSNND